MLKLGSIEGETVMITGGGTGLGHSFALRFAEAGATVALVARNAERLEAVAAEIRAQGGAAFVHQADIRDATAAQKVVDAIVAETGRLDEAGFYLCSPAANYINGEVLTIDGGEWLNKGAFVIPEAHRQ